MSAAAAAATLKKNSNRQSSHRKERGLVGRKRELPQRGQKWKGSVLFIDRRVELSVENLIERNLERLRGKHAGDDGNLVEDDVEQMLVVAGIDLDEHGVFADGVVALHHFGYLSHLVHDLLHEGQVVEYHAKKGAGLVAKLGDIKLKLRLVDDAEFLKARHALVDGWSGDVAEARDFAVGHTRVGGEDVEYFLVKRIQ